MVGKAGTELFITEKVTPMCTPALRRRMTPSRSGSGFGTDQPGRRTAWYGPRLLERSAIWSEAQGAVRLQDEEGEGRGLTLAETWYVPEAL